MSMENPYDYSVFDFDGMPIKITEWVDLGRTGWALDEMIDGYRVHTSWVGVDAPRYQVDKGRISKNQKDNAVPLIYQVYVWDADKTIVYADRAANKEEALKLHDNFKRQIALKSKLMTI